MNPDSSQNQRVLSGMRPTGALHLGHLHGVLYNWLKLQHTHECFFFVADWHALTTEYDNSRVISQSVMDMVVDWLAVGVNPNAATLFVQSHIPEHAELHLLLSMITPLGWLERVPTYKDQQEKLKVGFGFGWAKPVPVNFAQLRNPKRDMIWVAAAGPAANVVMALGWALIMKLGFLLLDQSQWVAMPLILAGQAGIVINLVLCLVNLIPIPPLDGGRILAGLAPARFLPALEKVEPLGMLIVFGLLALGGLTFILHPLLQFFSSVIGRLFGIPV